MIIFAMATHAVLTITAIRRIEMTALALHRQMRADQGKDGARVIKRRLLPIDVGVAVRTLLAEFVLMGIIIDVAIDAVARRTAWPGRALNAVLVAVRALRLGVRVVEGEIGIPIVLETTRVPFAGGMAVAALFAQTAFMRVVLAMAGHARNRRVMEVLCIGMTASALRVAMGTIQRKISVVVPEPGRTIPTLGVMAVTTSLAQAAAMGIVFGMTAGALLFQTAVVRRTAVAVDTGDFLVLAKQGKPGIAMVVARFHPVSLGMACRAVIAHRAFVGVVIAMTGHTLRIQIDLGRRLDMTVVAAHIRVFSQQLEFGQRMIKLGRQPIFGNVAFRAVIIERLLVGIVVTMALNASRRRFAVRLVLLMTIGTFDLGMATDQGEVGLGVVEVGLIKLGNARLTALVISVAIAAFGIR